MKEKYMKLKIELVVNKILYRKNIIDKELFENASRKIESLIWEETKK